MHYGVYYKFPEFASYTRTYCKTYARDDTHIQCTLYRHIQYHKVDQIVCAFAVYVSLAELQTIIMRLLTVYESEY